MAGPAALLFYPPTWVALGEAAKWTLITLGVAGAGVATGVAINEMTSENEDTAAPPATDTDTSTCAECEARRPCPACSPPAGTVEVERVDRVPPSRPHYPCPGDHYHTRVMRQNPRNCRCFWNKGPVHCLPQGGNPP